MKRKFIYIFTLIISFLFINSVKAESINSIKMDVYVDRDGNAHVTEVWDTNATEKTEYYHAYYNIGNSSVTDLKVNDENQEYTYTKWNLNGTLREKAYHYGYNYDYNGVELCFGKSSYGHHTYTLTYTIKNFISLTSDNEQVAYWTMINKINPAPRNVEIIIYADEPFEDTVPVWGYGNYGGEASVYEGKIYLTNDNLRNTEYMTFLAKFDPGTFEPTNKLNQSFDELFNTAEDGATHYNGSGNSSNIADKIIGFVILIFNSFIWIIIIMVAVVSSSNRTIYGTKNLKFGKDGRKIPKDTPMFRDIPCNKDVFRAYWVACQYNLVKKKTDFLGTMLLKWHKEGKVKIESKEKGKIFKKEDTVIVFNTSIETQVPLEKTLYDYMYEASKDGTLETKEFEKWCRTNYSKILRWFDRVIDYETEQLVNGGRIEEIEKKSFLITRKEYHVDPSMLDEAKQMKGLKEFFKEFKNMKDKEAIEVMLWEEYLMYAQIFGMANKVAEQFKKLYPDVITDYDYDAIVYFNTISYSGMSSAQSAQTRANSYSSGGGGFSSGGGGGGSFGGGGGSFGGGSR